MLDFASFPQELRDMIYEAALVRDVITVAPTKLQRCKKISRSTWQDIKTSEVAIPGMGRAGENIEPVTNSYYLQNNGDDAPNLAIFQTSRQVYAECWPIFYQRNLFDFSKAEKTITAASMCLAFLNDRPPQALQFIRRMHLQFGESLYHDRAWLNLRPYCPQWGQLCSQISTKLSLRQLVLSVSERYARSGIIDPGIVDFHPWVQEIRQITNLRELKVDVMCKGECEEVCKLINHLRARMLANKSGLQELGEMDFRYTEKMVRDRSWVAISNYSLDGVLVQRPARLNESDEEDMFREPFAFAIGMLDAW